MVVVEYWTGDKDYESSLLMRFDKYPELAGWSFSPNGVLNVNLDGKTIASYEQESWIKIHSEECSEGN